MKQLLAHSPFCEELCPFCDKVKSAFSSRVAGDSTLMYDCPPSYSYTSSCDPPGKVEEGKGIIYAG